MICVTAFLKTYFIQIKYKNYDIIIHHLNDILKKKLIIFHK